MTVKELIDELKKFPLDSTVTIPSILTPVVVEDMEPQKVVKNDYNGPLIC